MFSDNSQNDSNENDNIDTYVLISLIVDVIIFFFGLVGNLLVIHVQRKSKRQTRARYFLQLNAIGSIM